jgi:hypothetical protein
MSLRSSASNSLTNLAGLLSGQSSGRSTPTKQKRMKVTADVYSADVDGIGPAPPGGVQREEERIETESQYPDGTGPDFADFNNLHTDQLAAQKFNITNNDPVGHILVQLLSECTEQARKNKKSMNFGINDLCDMFYNHKINERQKLKHRIQLATEDWGTELIQRKLRSHTLATQIKPPKSFASAPAIETNKQMMEILRLIPTGGQKFSGKNSKMSILEYLFGLNMMQQHCNLTEKEFLRMMLASTTGEPHLLLTRWIQEKDEVDTIYHNLLLHYDTRIEPEEARIKLHAYKAPRTANLAQVEVQIQNLASATTSALPEGAARDTAYNYEQIQALIRSLPMQSSMMVRNGYTSLSTDLGRPAKAAELSKYLNTVRYSIDQDLKAHGVGDRRFPENRRFFSAAKPAGKFITRNYTAYNMTQGPSSPQNNYNNGYQNGTPRPYLPTGSTNLPTGSTNRPTYNRTPDNRTPYPRQSSGQSGAPRRSFGNGTGQFRGNTSNMKTAWKDKYGSSPANRGQRSGGRFNGNSKPMTYCSLCGKNNHTAVQGCRYMVTDSGRQVQVMPTKDTCPNCPVSVSPRLSHPVHLCPFRTGGPLCGK